MDDTVRCIKFREISIGQDLQELVQEIFGEIYKHCPMAAELLCLPNLGTRKLRLGAPLHVEGLQPVERLSRREVLQVLEDVCRRQVLLIPAAGEDLDAVWIAVARAVENKLESATQQRVLLQRCVDEADQDLQRPDPGKGASQNDRARVCDICVTDARARFESSGHLQGHSLSPFAHFRENLRAQACFGPRRAGALPRSPTL